ncbi:HNH endonuclease [Corynebacterium diphtheriae]|nr:HNH endonuclease [Corynebacterium diphtheriae]CAB0938236.1 HNH endonuclease [Corynebacterium diphtheriae]
MAKRELHIPPAVRAKVLTRSGFRCEAGVPEAGCTGRVGALHHRLFRSRGGGHTVWNLVGICVPCHLWIHANDHAAKRYGLSVSRHCDAPEQVPVLRRGAMVVYDADGGWEVQR